MSDVYLNYFEHYGVKGMKWGIRIEDVIDKFGPRLESEYQRFVENRDS